MTTHTCVVLGQAHTTSIHGFPQIKGMQGFPINVSWSCQKRVCSCKNIANDLMESI